MSTKILRHALNIKRLFPLVKNVSPLALCRELAWLEKRANSIAVRQCNENVDPEMVNMIEKDVASELKTLLGLIPGCTIPVQVNCGDPRGFALTIPDTRIQGRRFITDMGGQGILAPFDYDELV